MMHVYFLKSFEYCNFFSVFYMPHHGEGNIYTQQNQKWYTIYKEYFCCYQYLFMKLDKLFWDFNNVLYDLDCFSLVVFPFKSTMLFPQIVCVMSIYCTFTIHSMIIWLWKINLKTLTDGYPSLAYIVFLALHY